MALRNVGFAQSVKKGRLGTATGTFFFSPAGLHSATRCATYTEQRCIPVKAQFIEAMISTKCQYSHSKAATDAGTQAQISIKNVDIWDQLRTAVSNANIVARGKGAI